MSDKVGVLDLRTKEIRVINPIPPQKGLPMLAWSADGEQPFLTALSEGNWKLLEMDPSGHTRVLLKNPWGWIADPLPSPDGKRIVYRYGVGESNVTLLEHF